MTKSSSAAAFLENMKQGTEEETLPSASLTKVTHTKENASSGTRRGLKHIGGYLALETVERVAILRARLDLDNSQLIKLAIDELYSKQKAKRAFND
jgi:predicted transcriptional regulator